MEAAIRETHATFISFHHWPREWLKENYNLSVKFANLCGYWYFPKYAVLSDTLSKSSSSNYMKMTWENHGVAPSYQKFMLRIKLHNTETGENYILTMKESNNLNWLPGTIVGEKYKIDLPHQIPTGDYNLLVGLFLNTKKTEKGIDISLKNDLKDTDGFFKIGKIIVSN